MLRKLIPVALVTASLAVVTSVSAATTTVAITKAGFVPSATTINVGDSVTWTNNDSTNHQVISQEGGFASPIMKPGETWSRTFEKAGSFSYNDAFNKTFKGTVTVNGPPSTLTLNGSTSLVTYGQRMTLSGMLSSKDAGMSIDILKIECGSTANAPEKVATTTTTTGGDFSQLVRPLKNSRYVARFRTSTSDSFSVKVKPRITLGKVAPHRYTVRVYAAQSFAGHIIVLQRFNRFTGTWLRVRTAVLRVGPETIEPTEISSVTMKAKVRGHTRLRVIMTQANVGSCYLPGRSNVIFS
jgi:plastocyanin